MRNKRAEKKMLYPELQERALRSLPDEGRGWFVEIYFVEPPLRVRIIEWIMDLLKAVGIARRT